MLAESVFVVSLTLEEEEEELDVIEFEEADSVFEEVIDSVFAEETDPELEEVAVPEDAGDSLGLYDPASVSSL